MANILIKNATVIPMNTLAGEQKYFTGSIGIAGNKIAMVDADGSKTDKFIASCKDDLTVINADGNIVMPGLINTHNHSAMTFMRGYADDIQLMSWLNDYVFPYESKMSRDDVYWGSLLGCAEMLLGGTTTVVDMYYHGEAVGEAFEKGGMRGVIAANIIDESRDGKYLNDLVARYGDGKASRITMMVAPHSPYTLSSELLIKTKELADKLGVWLCIHLAETMDEVQIVEERHGKTPTKYLYDLGLLTPTTLLAHGVHLTDNDMELIRQSGASIAHNPQCNMKISSGIARVAELLSMGVNVAIGTDGPCSNNDMDMWDEMRSASFLQKSATGDPLVLPAYQVLQMATLGGAKAIGREGELGQLAEGYIADVIVIDTKKPHLMPQHDPIANLVYAANAADVDTVIVDGQIVVRERKLLNINLPELFTEVGARCKKKI